MYHSSKEKRNQSWDDPHKDLYSGKKVMTFKLDHLSSPEESIRPEQIYSQNFNI